VEGFVAGVFEDGLGEAFVVVDRAVADELYLRYTRDGLEVRVKDRLCGPFGFVISVAVAL
jgi:hypothetical protein